MGNAERITQDARSKSKRHGNTGKLISSYYLEIEYLLNRVEQSSTYYQALALERSATPEDVVRAYQETIKVLHTLTPVGVAMAGENEMDPYKD